MFSLANLSKSKGVKNLLLKTSSLVGNISFINLFIQVKANSAVGMEWLRIRLREE